MLKFNSLVKEDLELPLLVKTPGFKMHGSKAMIASRIVQTFPKNFSVYVEPFVGRGNVFFELLNLGNNFRFKHFFINDAFMKFVPALIEYSGDFSFIPEGPITRQLYEKFRDSQDSLERTIAESCLAYNGNSYGRGANITGDNGNCHSKEATIIRMKNAKFLLDYFAEKIEFFNEDYLEFLEGFDNRNVFVYLDPPYIGTKTFYPNIEHEQLCWLLNRSKFSYVMSNYASTLYDKNLDFDKRITFQRVSTAKANSGKSGKEIVVKEVVYVKIRR